MDDDLKFKHPFTSIISGPTGSGKSTFCIRLLQNRKLLCTEQEFNGGTFWCFCEKAAVPDRELSELKAPFVYTKAYRKTLKTRTANLV
jgi:ABC-type lipoprotein export system ATPase subunit